MKLDTAQWRALSDLLDRALELTPTARSAWIESLGGSDAVLAPMLREMLAHEEHVESGRFLATSSAFLRDEVGASHFSDGSLIGPYRLLRPIGAGGMGEVWLAERADGALNRLVALKLPLLALSRNAVAERFARERDILAALEHPHIARLYDAGVTADGQPYLALEHVDGVPVDRYADVHRLDVAARLALFEQVLDAVAYAHANLVLHRDIKPSNVLVTAEGKAKLLDFGIAKLMADDGQAQETALTRLSGRAMTLDYAAPEQIAALPLTTAADIYSLGVVLYELLTGERPYRTRHGTQAELAEAIAAGDVVAPSTARFDDTAATARGASVPRLRRVLRGDIDVILQKALRPRPEDRYASVRAFAEDLQRHRAGQPVLAQPDSVAYRARKFAGRHRVGLSAAVLVALVLVGATIVSMRQAHQATLEARRANAVQAFMTDLFRANSSQQADPVRARQTTALELLDLGANRIGVALDDAPAAKLATLQLFGDLYDELEVNDRAVDMRRQALALSRAQYGAGDARIASQLLDLDYSLRASSHVNERPDTLAEAGQILDALQDDHSALRARLDMRLADFYNSTDRPRALEYAMRAVTLYRGLGADDLSNALYTRAQIENNLGRWDAARSSIKEAIALTLREHGDANADLAQYYANLAEIDFGRDDVAGAEDSFRRALASARAVNGDNHVDTLQTELRLGKFLIDTDRMEEGLRYLADARALALRLRGADDPFHTPTALLEYGWGLVRHGEIEQGLANIEQAIANRRRNRPGTQFLAVMLEDAAYPLVDLGRFDEARRDLDESRGIKLAFEQPPSVTFNHNASVRARLARAEGMPDDALRALRDFHVDKRPGELLSRSQVGFDLEVADLALAEKDYARAADVALSVRERITGSALAPYLRSAEARAALCEARAHLALREASEALPLAERAADIRRELLAPGSPLRLDAQLALAQAYRAVGRADDARRALDEASAIRARTPGLGPQYTRALDDTARMLASR